MKKAAYPFRVDNANPVGTRAEEKATDAEGSGEWGKPKEPFFESDKVARGEHGAY
jgi:hypothetical protein